MAVGAQVRRLVAVGPVAVNSTPVALAVVMAIALAVRLAAVVRLPLHLDEPNSVLAATMIAEKGFPLLPSGVLYLHGATLSYLMAPLLAFGIADIDHLLPFRLISAVSGGASVYATYLLTKRIFGGAWVGIGAALLLALDPLSIVWSGHTRMYALEQLFVVLTALAFIGAVDEQGVMRRGLGWLVLVFWLAVYSHLGAAMLWPAMALVALVLFGRDLFRRHGAVLLALGACLLAPVSLAVLSTLVGGGAGTRGETEPDFLPGLSVLGDANLDLSRLLQPSLVSWMEAFEAGWFGALIPVLLAILSGVLAGRWLLQGGRSESSVNAPRIGALLALYWIPVALFAFVAISPPARYFDFLQPMACALLAGGVAVLWRNRPLMSGYGGTAMAAVAAVAGLLMFGHALSALVTFDEWIAFKGSDLRKGLDVVAERREPGELVLVGSAPVGYLKIGDIPALRFLAGDESLLRSQRYVRTDEASGKQVDYWIGMEAINSIQGLCIILKDNPGSWIVLEDTERRHAARGLNGPVADVVRGSGDLVYEEDRGVVFRSREAKTWDGPAHRSCRGTKAG